MGNAGCQGKNWGYCDAAVGVIQEQESTDVDYSQSSPTDVEDVYQWKEDGCRTAFVSHVQFAWCMSHISTSRRIALVGGSLVRNCSFISIHRFVFSICSINSFIQSIHIHPKPVRSATVSCVTSTTIWHCS